MVNYVIYKVKGKDLKHYATATSSSPQNALNLVAKRNNFKGSELKAKYMVIPVGKKPISPKTK